MTYSIKAKFGTDHEIEVQGENYGVLCTLINEATKKFFPKTTYLEHDMST